MSELIIIASDWYAAESTAALERGGTAALAGLDEVARFGERRPLGEGWRSWLARRIGREDLAAAAPAAVAELAIPAAPSALAHPFVWFATPLALVPGLTHVALDRSGVLRLEPAAQERLALDFARQFQDSGWQLVPLSSGEFLLYGPELRGAVRTSEPARFLGASLTPHLPSAPQDPELRRLAAEIEMWLHAQVQMNMIPTRAGVRPLSTLWVWGGGARLGQAHATGRRATGAAFSTDPYVRGLWAATGAPSAPLPGDLAGVPPGPLAIVVDTVWIDREDAHPDPALALARFDARWVEPAVRCVARRRLGELVVIANDHALHLRPRDLLKRWRRARSAQAALR